MGETSFSGDSLEKALQEGHLDSGTAELRGMVKTSDESGHVAFSRAGCDTWVDIPTDMIEHAEHVGSRSCGDHSHPVVTISLKEPTDPEGQILAALLSQVTQGGIRWPNHLSEGISGLAGFAPGAKGLRGSTDRLPSSAGAQLAAKDDFEAFQDCIYGCSPFLSAPCLEFCDCLHLTPGQGPAKVLRCYVRALRAALAP